MRSIIFLLTIVLSLPGLARTDLDALERALSGDLDALEACWEESDDENAESWRELVRGFALQAAGRPDAAVEAWQDAVRLGDRMAVRALALHFAEREQWLQAYGWSQLAMEVTALEQDLNRNQLGGQWALYNAVRAAEGLDPSQHDAADDLARSILDSYGPALVADTGGENDDRYPGLEPIKRTAPSYPARAARRGAPGWAVTVLEIGPDGRVGRTVPLAATDDAFARAAERAIRTWRFDTGSIEDFPIVSRQTIDFSLSR